MERLKKLCTEWQEAKADEVAAKARRVAIEADIDAIVGHKEEGNKTNELAGFKVTTTGTINRKMDWAKWEEVKSQISSTLWPVKTKLELDEAGIKYLKVNEPNVYALLPLTVTPGSTKVEVKTVEAA